MRRYIALNRFEIYGMPVYISPKGFCHGGSDLRESLAAFEKSFISESLAKNHCENAGNSQQNPQPENEEPRNKTALSRDGQIINPECKN